MGDILNEFKANEPAAARSVGEAERQLGIRLPSDYREFLLRHDGGEGVIGSHYVVIWKTNELPRFNSEYQLPVYVPGFV